MKTQRPNQEHAPRSKEREQKKIYARDVMTKNATCVEPGERVVDAAKKLSQLDVGSLPVCDGGRLVGIITDRDIVVRVLAEDQNVTEAVVEDAMSDDVVSVYEDDDINTLVKRMEEHEVRRMPVINRDSELVGIVALADLANSNASPALKAKGLQGVS
jgi:CBS domain-containing protein